MKKILAIVAMLVLTLSMACAEQIKFTVDVNTDADNGKKVVDLTDAKGEVTFKFTFTDAWGGGGVGYNSVAAGAWKNCEYSNEKETEIKIDPADITVGDDGKKVVEVQCWWVGANEGFEAAYTCDYTIPSGDGADEGGKTETTPSETGDVMNIALLSVVAVLAFAGVVVSSKKRA